MDRTLTLDTRIALAGVQLNGQLVLPEHPKGLIVFAHGSGSNRFSKRNRQVAQYLQQQQFGTLLFDLLTEEESTYPEYRLDTALLSQRLIHVTHWLQQKEATRDLKMGFFGSSTGAAAALEAAATLPGIRAVVCRGGRPDLAWHSLPFVRAAVLLLVGTKDPEVLQLNEAAFRHLNCIRELELVERATHLFEEPGALEEVCRAAARWFQQHLNGHA